MKPGAVGAVGAITLLLVSGCASLEADASKAQGLIGDGVPVGSILGMVLDDERIPIQNATVTVVGMNLSATSDAAGGFGFPLVPIGDHFLVARSAGHKERQQGITVVEGTTTNLTLLLTSIPKPVPRVETSFARHALNCRIVVGHPAGGVNGNSKNQCLGTAVGNYQDNRSGTRNAQNGLVGALIELSWTQNTGASRNLRLETDLAIGPSGDDGALRTFMTEGPSPLNVELHQADLQAYLAHYKGRRDYGAYGGPLHYETDVRPSLLGQAVDVGFALDQKVDFAFSLFYVVEPSDYVQHRQY